MDDAESSSGGTLPEISHAGFGSSRRTAAIVAEGDSRAKAFVPVTIS
ncbi:MAG: hypothetical protein IPN03_09740 [Holophagales bacterium]|nr:hypothetical protein [Holophagales bacterium]